MDGPAVLTQYGRIFHTRRSRHSYTRVTGSFLGAERAKRNVNHPAPFSAEVKERAELCLYTHSVPSWQVIG